MAAKHCQTAAAKQTLKTLATAACFFILTQASVYASEPLIEFSGATMGTAYSIKVAGDSVPEDLQQQVDQRLDEINALMSTYEAESEVSRFNRAPAETWFEVSAETLQVVLLAQEISRTSDGAFDITTGPLVRLWGFGAGAETTGFKPPGENEIKTVLAKTGFSRLKVRKDPPALQKLVDGLEIDLSGIAKGYAVDQVAQVLMSHGIKNYLVEIGGEVRVGGERSAGAPWRVGIEAPDTDARRVHSVLKLTSTAMASSGDYRNYHEYDGVRYSHTINPSTGRPVSHNLTAVTTLAKDCATADAAATAILVLGPEQGKMWAESQGIAAISFSRTEGAIKQQQTDDFPKEIFAEKDTPAASLSGMLLASAVIFGLAILAMSIGVVFGRSRIRGSCGGLANLKDKQGNPICQACTKPSPDCDGTPESP